MSRVEWLNLVLRHGRPTGRARQLLTFLVFEGYYQLCKLRGYPARHLLIDPPKLKETMPGHRYMLISPPLPPSIRLLDKLFGTAGHAYIAPYTPEAAAVAREAGQHVAVVGVNSGELKFLRE